MPNSAIDASQRRAAKIFSLAYLFSVALVMFGQFAIKPHLLVAGNPAATARNIVANERLFRLDVACDLTYSIGVVVVLTALYVVLRKVSPYLALLAAHCRLVYALPWAFMA